MSEIGYISHLPPNGDPDPIVFTKYDVERARLWREYVEGPASNNPGSVVTVPYILARSVVNVESTSASDMRLALDSLQNHPFFAQND